MDELLRYGVLAHKTYRAYKYTMPMLRGTKLSSGPVTRSKYATRLDYRLAKIERNIRNVRPELKQFQLQGTQTLTSGVILIQDITSLIEQGDEEFNRTGNQIRVQGIRITGILGNSTYVVPFVLLSPNAIYPNTSDFTTAGLPQVKIDKSDDHKVLKYLLGYQGQTQIAYNRKFSNGLLVKYNASSGYCETHNSLTMGIFNAGAQQHGFNYTITVYFTDV